MAKALNSHFYSFLGANPLSRRIVLYIKSFNK